MKVSIRKLFLFLSLSCIVVTSRAQPPRHVILISIDGLRPAFYLDGSWPTPNLQSLMKNGIYAREMKSVFPSFTYPSHAAMVTGALPARSGVYYNAPFEPVASSGNWNWALSVIKMPTIWQALRRQGLVTAAVQWPVSVGDQIDYNIPEIWSTLDPADRISVTRLHATKGLVEEIEQFATGQLTSQNMNEHYLSLDDNAARMAAYIFSKYKPHLLALHFAGVDGAQHAQGTNGEQVKLAVAAVDRAIGHVLETVRRSAVADSTTILIVGDHGFADFDTVLRPNIWLAHNNLLQKGDKWRARFQPAGGSAFLYLEDAKDQAAITQIRQLLLALPAEQRQLFGILERKTLDSMGVDSSALLALTAKQGVVFGGAAKGEVISMAHGGHHGYDPNWPPMMTGFIAAGSGIKKGGQLQQVQICDVASLIAALLHTPFTAPDGHLPPGVLTGE